METIEKPFVQIDRKYRITSAELRKALKLEGEIMDMGLYEGRSPNDITAGISADKDKWEINTREVKKINTNAPIKNN